MVKQERTVGPGVFTLTIILLSSFSVVVIFGFPALSSTGFVPRPAVAKLWGQGAAALRYRRDFQQRVVANLPVGVVDWATLANVCHDSAVAVLGVQPRTPVRPWLAGRLGQLRALDAHIALAHRADREVRSSPRPWSWAQQHRAVQVRSALNQAAAGAGHSWPGDRS